MKSVAVTLFLGLFISACGSIQILEVTDADRAERELNFKEKRAETRGVIYFAGGETLAFDQIIGWQVEGTMSTDRQIPFNSATSGIPFEDLEELVVRDWSLSADGKSLTREGTRIRIRRIEGSRLDIEPFHFLGGTGFAGIEVLIIDKDTGREQKRTVRWTRKAEFSDKHMLNIERVVWLRKSL